MIVLTAYLFNDCFVGIFLHAFYTGILYSSVESSVVPLYWFSIFVIYTIFYKQALCVTLNTGHE